MRVGILIALLHRLADFLDRKFPDKVWVRRADYDALVARVQATEAKISRVETALGFQMMGAGKPFER